MQEVNAQSLVSTDIWAGYIVFGISLPLSAIFLAAYKKGMLWKKSYGTLPDRTRGSRVAEA